MKKVFISHPYSDSPAINLEKATIICQKIMESEADILPISPLHHFSFLDNDDGVRGAIMETCLHNIEHCAEVWVFGSSEGCQQEVQYAEENGIEVKYIDDINTHLVKIE